MKITKAGLALAIAAIVLIAAAIPLSVTNFTQVHIDQKPQGGTATPRFFVTNLDGPSDIIVAEDNATPVFAVRSGGAVEVLVGPFTNSGNQTITGILTVTGASKLGGNISSQTGSLTMTDNVVITGNLVVSGTSDLVGNISSSTGAITAADTVLIDGQTDAIQLTVQGWTTQTTNLTVFEQSDGTDVFTITNAGNIEAAGTVEFGSDDNFALGYATSTQELACVSSLITGTAAVAVTGVTTPTFGWATMVTDPGAGAGDPFLVTFDAPTTTTLQVNVWQDDANAATVVATVHVCAIGNE